MSVMYPNEGTCPVCGEFVEDVFTCCRDGLEELEAPMPPLDVEATFGPQGPLARPGYEARPGQVRLSRAIYDALAGGTHLIAEGPCGIGKSKAYGVPAAHLAAHGKRVLIVTASIALQEQLISKDLPDLRKELGWDFDFALMKGKSNYLCLEARADADDRGLEYAQRQEYQQIVKWGQTTRTGDRAELPIVPSQQVWGRFATSAQECHGSKCARYSDCYAYAAKDRAAQPCTIVVANYHLFLLDLQMGGRVLPPYDAVILDEAHEAPDLARELLGFNLSEWGFSRIAREADKRGFPQEADSIRRAALDFFDTCARFAASGHYASFLRHPLPVDSTHLRGAVEAFMSSCARSRLVGYAADLLHSLKLATEVSDQELVVSIEVNEKSGKAKLVGRYVEPGPALRRLLWSKGVPVVAVSATLTTDGSFAFAQRELGAPEGIATLAVDSPFDFERAAMLVTPDMPEANGPDYARAVAQQIAGTIDACGGRTLALFTSYKGMRAAAEAVRRTHGRTIRVLCQGDAPLRQLVADFKTGAGGGVVLFGVASLWTGVDVQGEALTGLVIDRIPFANPDDPVSKRISEVQPRTAFDAYTVPRAILQLRQGVGRLIRSQSDVGAVVLLDPRLRTKGYGKRFLRSLPPMARATNTGAIRAFLAARTRTEGTAA